MTKMNGERTTESVSEDKEKILSLRKVFVSGPWYTTSEVGVGLLGEVERLRYCVNATGIWELNLPMWGKPCLQGWEIRNSERCMEEGPKRMSKQAPPPGVIPQLRVENKKQNNAPCQVRTGDLRMTPGIQAHN